MQVEKSCLRSWLKKRSWLFWPNSGFSWDENPHFSQVSANSIHEVFDARTGIEDSVAEQRFAKTKLSIEKLIEGL